jgi:uncharacterized membrane protein YfcA
VDTEWLKVLGGLLAVVAAALNLLNALHSRTKSADEKPAVTRHTLDWLSISLTVAGLLVSILSGSYLLGTLFFTVNAALLCYAFLRNPAPPRRVDILAIGLLCAIFVSSWLFYGLGLLIDKIIDLEVRTVDVLKSQTTKPPPSDGM